MHTIELCEETPTPIQLRNNREVARFTNTRRKRYHSPTNDATQLPQHIVQSYWDTSDAHKLFGGERGECVRETVYNRIIKLREATLTSNGLRDIVMDGENKLVYDENFVHHVKKKAKYLYHALTIALRKKEKTGLKWQLICGEAVEK